MNNMKICIFLTAILAHSAASVHGPLLTALTQSRFISNGNGSIGIKEHTTDLDSHRRNKRNLLLGLAAGAVGGGVVGVGLLKAGMYGAKALGAGAFGGIVATKAFRYGHGPEKFGYAYGPGPGFGPVIGQGGVHTFGSIFGSGQGTSYGTGYEPGFGPGYGSGYGPGYEPGYGPVNGPGYGSGYGPVNRPGYEPEYRPGYRPGYGPSHGYCHYRYGALTSGCRCWNYGAQPQYGDDESWW